LPFLINYALFDHEVERICKTLFTILHYRFQQRIRFTNVKFNASQGQKTYTYYLKLLA